MIIIPTFAGGGLPKWLKSDALVRDDIQFAIDAWAKPLADIDRRFAIVFRFADLRGNSFGNASGVNGVLTVTFRNTPPAKLYHGNGTWWERMWGIGLRSLAMHEIGHAIGLHGHSKSVTSIMKADAPRGRFSAIPAEDIAEAKRILSTK